MSATLFILLVTSQTVRGSSYPSWLGDKWKVRDESYERVLQEVRPFYTANGFIAEETVRQKYVMHVKNFLRRRDDSLLLMRALAWHELALSDGNIFKHSDAKLLKEQFVDALRLHKSPVQSFAQARTLAICLYYSTAPDTFANSRLLEKLYAYDRSDTELELAYLTWACLNLTNAPNQLTLERLLQKQEKLEFRRGGRRDSLSFCYTYLSFHSPKSKRLLEKGLQLKRQYFESLPSGHSDNTEEFRQQMIALEKNLRSLSKNWSD